MSGDLPTIKEELERKTLETYDWLIQRLGAGQIGSAEVKIALQTVFNVTCGLVSRDITEAAEAVEFDDSVKVTRKRIFKAAHVVFIVSWAPGDRFVNVDAVKAVDVVRKQYESDDSRDALQKFAQICKAMLDKGAVEIH